MAVLVEESASEYSSGLALISALPDVGLSVNKTEDLEAWKCTITVLTLDVYRTLVHAQINAIVNLGKRRPKATKDESNCCKEFLPNLLKCTGDAARIRGNYSLS